MLLTDAKDLVDRQGFSSVFVVDLGTLLVLWLVKRRGGKRQIALDF